MTHMWLKRLNEWQSAGIPCALVTIIDAQGSTPRKTGSKMALSIKGETAGSIGGGTVEQACIKLAITALAENRCLTKRFASKAEGEEWVSVDNDTTLVVCGGALTVFIEPLTAEPEIVIFGAGHIGQSLAKLCAAMDMPFRVYDDRPDYATSARFSEARQCICAPFTDIAGNITLSHLSYCVIMTYGHDQDEVVLEQLLKNQDLPYIGMVGSPNKARVLIDNIKSRGGTIDGRLYCPVGLRLGRNLPQDIALSVLSEVVLLSRGGNLAHMRIDWKE
jgi:xanthine dehydrogenase accessory factor